jgi:hypothetical protein
MMRNLERLAAAIAKAAKRHAKWGLRRASPLADQMFVESKQALYDRAQRLADALVDHFTREMASK